MKRGGYVKTYWLQLFLFWLMIYDKYSSRQRKESFTVELVLVVQASGRSEI